MRTLTEFEVEKWTSGLAVFDQQNELIVCSMLATFGYPPGPVIDWGSGTGAMVNTYRKLGIEAYGFDLLPRPAHAGILYQHDIGEPLYDFPHKARLATCIEVAEHVETEHSDALCDNIMRYLDTSGTSMIVFTAAMPGQAGDGHINCQHAEFWRRRFADRGMTYRADLTYRLALAWSVTHTALHHLEANLQVFTRPGDGSGA